MLRKRDGLMQLAANLAAAEDAAVHVAIREARANRSDHVVQLAGGDALSGSAPKSRTIAASSTLSKTAIAVVNEP